MPPKQKKSKERLAKALEKSSDLVAAGVPYNEKRTRRETLEAAVPKITDPDLSEKVQMTLVNRSFDNASTTTPHKRIKRA